MTTTHAWRLAFASALVTSTLACGSGTIHQDTDTDTDTDIDEKPPASVDPAILFTTHVPIATSREFGSFAATFANHQTARNRTPRGGDLYIRYEDGTLRNLTEEAGFGLDGAEGDNAIAVREPTVHWNGGKALFSMVVGSSSSDHWQIYEIEGIAQGETAVITRIEGQPAQYNNVSPIYTSDDRILFSSDAPITGSDAHYPHLDEYESTPTVTGIWRLDPDNGEVVLLDHAPSGDFNLSIDSFGRVLFTRWDHLQRDQQADGDVTTRCFEGNSSTATHGARTYASEAPGAASVSVEEQCQAGDLNYSEVFPEPGLTHAYVDDPGFNPSGATGHRFNHFFPWTMNQDGTDLETLNHIGRHELHGFFRESFPNDPDLREFNGPNPAPENMLDPFEDPDVAGRYYMIDAPEFLTLGGGPILMLDAPVGKPASQIPPVFLTDPDRVEIEVFRNPRGLMGGALIASHSPRSENMTYRLVLMEKDGAFYVPAGPLTSGIQEPDVFEGNLWELGATEVRVRERPPANTLALDTPEANVFADVGVDVEAMRAFLRDNDLALIVSRNVTTRDEADRQQPYNLRIAGTSTSTTGASSQRLYDVAFMQLFENKLIRSYEDRPENGRRGIAQFMDNPTALANNPTVAGAPEASVALGADGSMAAFVPARRALVWQLTAPDGEPVVRERYWVTFQPGEIRVCASCHGLNERDQAGGGVPQNEPAALRSLLELWLSRQ